MDIDPYKDDPADSGTPVLREGFREASAGEIRRWRLDVRTLRSLYEAALAKEADYEFLVVDDVFGGTAWKRGQQEGHGALVLRAGILEEALKPQGV